MFVQLVCLSDSKVVSVYLVSVEKDSENFVMQQILVDITHGG